MRRRNRRGGFYRPGRRLGCGNFRLAAGAGAISKFVLPGERLERVENVKNVEQYINRIDEMIERKRTFMERHQLG